MNQSGIYMIITDVNKKFYIGSAIDLKDRFKRHISTLQRNCHPNTHLQNVWNKYENCQLKFYILEFCEKSDVVKREQYYIDLLKPEYNLNPTAYSRKGAILSDETKQKISNKLSNIPHSSERRRNQSIAQLGLKRPAKRKTDKWPHENGNRCKCRDCKEKLSVYLKNYWITYERK